MVNAVAVDKVAQTAPKTATENIFFNTILGRREKACPVKVGVMRAKSGQSRLWEPVDVS
jgi:hypothetical protein